MSLSNVLLEICLTKLCEYSLKFIRKNQLIVISNDICFS